MSKTELSKEEYLRKYISGNVSKKSKKDKNNQSSISRMKIIEDDLDLKSLELQVNDVDDDEFLDPDCQPSVAEVIDDRPMDKRGAAAKWKTVNESTDSSKDRLKRPSNRASQNNTQKKLDANNSLSRRQQNNSCDRNKTNDSDTSPPRRQRHDSDTSPPRRQRHDSDTSPPRRQRHDSDTSPPRRQRHDSDTSPPRRQRHDSDTSPPRRQRLDSDTSPPGRKESKTVNYPTHNSQTKHHQSYTAQQKLSKNSSSSYPDKINSVKNGNFHSDRNNSLNSKPSSHRVTGNNDSQFHDSRRKQSYSPKSRNLSVSKALNRNNIELKEEPLSDCEDNGRIHSTKLKQNTFTDENAFQLKKFNRHSTDKYSSAARKDHYFKNQENETTKEKVRGSKGFDNRHNRISKLSDRRDSRENLKSSDSQHVSDKMHCSSGSSESGDETFNLPKKTLSGAKAGLSSAAELKAEMKRKRKEEEKYFNKLDPEVLGKNAKTVLRSSKRPKELTSEEKIELAEKEEKRKQIQSKYDKWGRGLKQVSEQERRVDEDAYEMSKPLARYHGDKDLEKRLKDEVYEEEDPMASYILQKRTKKSKRKSDSDKESLESSEKKTKKKELPLYKGDAPPNRYGIRPGYRWDGVDRSSGFEKRYFEMINKRKSIKVSAYKWSVEDM